MRLYNPNDWYWIVGGDTRVYSSLIGDYRAANDPIYVAWQDTDPPTTPTRIANLTDLAGVLIVYHPSLMPVAADVLAAYQEALKNVAPVIVASAHAVVQSAAISLTGSPFNIASAAYLVRGSFRFTFIKPLSNTNYSGLITAAGSPAEMTNLAVDAFTINVSNQGGAGFDPRYIDFLLFSK